MNTELPDYGSPPINEVAMGLRFAPIDGFLLTHIGLFWSSLKEEFGKSEDAIPMGTMDDLPMSKGGGPLPRTWLIHNDPQYLIQLQTNIFFFNWRRLDEDQEYPRYSAIRPRFYASLDLFFKFLAHEKLPRPKTTKCELTYVNMLRDIRDPESPEWINSAFPDLTWRESAERFLPMPKSVFWQSNFDMPDGAGELTAKIQSAKRVADGEPVIRFEISARGPQTELPIDDTMDWFDLAHKTIVLSFADLTSAEIQQEVWNLDHARN